MIRYLGGHSCAVVDINTNTISYQRHFLPICWFVGMCATAAADSRKTYMYVHALYVLGGSLKKNLQRE